MDSYEDDDYYAEVNAWQTGNYAGNDPVTVPEVSRYGFGFPISGDHLTRYGAK